jgi:L-aminopeptidase/D-esterase-like protein
VSPEIQPPLDFLIGHQSDAEGMTGCTVVVAPAGTRGGVDVRGGGPGTRETDAVGPYATTGQVTAVVLSGGSAFGLAAADGAMRWLEEHGRGFLTPAGIVPIVPAAVIFDIAVGDSRARPGPNEGYAACESAAEGAPATGSVGVGTGATVGKILGHERCTKGGLGYGAMRTGTGETVAAIAVVNALGDVIAEDGTVMAGPRGEDGGFLRTADLIAAMDAPPDWNETPQRNTSLACVMTDAALDKPACARVARMASAGLARAIDPVYSDVDGDTVFCLASGEGPAEPFTSIVVGTLAATVVAAAIRSAVRSA